jgi:hypothetical protein
MDQALIEAIQVAINRVEELQKETRVTLAKVQETQEETRITLVKTQMSQQQTESNVSLLTATVNCLTTELRTMQRNDDRQAGRDDYIHTIKTKLVYPVIVAGVISVVSLLINLVWLFLKMGGR